MRKVYLDTTQAEMCISVFVNDAEVILAGASVNAMSVKQKNSEYQRFAIDSIGDYIGSIGQQTDLQEDIPICYIDADKNCYLIAENGKEFFKDVHQWREHLTLCIDIDFFKSFKAAREQYEFLDRVKLEQELKNTNDNYSVQNSY